MRLALTRHPSHVHVRSLGSSAAASSSNPPLPRRTRSSSRLNPSDETSRPYPPDDPPEGILTAAQGDSAAISGKLLDVDHGRYGAGVCGAWVRVRVRLRVRLRTTAAMAQAYAEPGLKSIRGSPLHPSIPNPLRPNPPHPHPSPSPFTLTPHPHPTPSPSTLTPTPTPTPPPRRERLRAWSRTCSDRTHPSTDPSPPHAHL